MQPLLYQAIEAAIAAAAEIMDVYDNHDFQIQQKDDNSPLTVADLRAHHTIKNRLEKTGIPLLSEEGAEIPYGERKLWERFWMVDPLDGTKEFIKRGGDFTVNIALVENNTPVTGVVYAPVLQQLYYGDPGGGAFICNQATIADTPESIARKAMKIPLFFPGNAIRIVASKSHLNEATEAFIANLDKEAERPVETVSIGSSLKLCLVAEGKADVYPRFGPTMEWDTAAGHAVVKAAGKSVLQADNQQELKYNKENLLNPFFIVK